MLCNMDNRRPWYSVRSALLWVTRGRTPFLNNSKRIGTLIKKSKFTVFTLSIKLIASLKCLKVTIVSFDMVNFSVKHLISHKEYLPRNVLLDNR